MNYKIGDFIEFVDVDKIIGEAKRYFKNGDIAKVSKRYIDSIGIIVVIDDLEFSVIISDDEYEYIKPFSKADIDKNSQYLVNNIMSNFDDVMIEQRQNYLLKHRRFDELKELLTELNKVGENNE